MYADFSKERIDTFLRDLTGQPDQGAFEQISEDLLDDIMLAQMEMARFRTARDKGRDFVARARMLAGRPRLHPADLH